MEYLIGRENAKNQHFSVCENTPWELRAPTEWHRSKMSTTTQPARNPSYLYLCTAKRKKIDNDKTRYAMIRTRNFVIRI